MQHTSVVGGLFLRFSCKKMDMQGNSKEEPLQE